MQINQTINQSQQQNMNFKRSYRLLIPAGKRNAVSHELSEAIFQKGDIFTNVPDENTVKLFDDNSLFQKGFEALTVFVKESAERFTKLKNSGFKKGSEEMDALFADIPEENVFVINHDADAQKFLQEKVFPELGI